MKTTFITISFCTTQRNATILLYRHLSHSKTIHDHADVTICYRLLLLSWSPCIWWHNTEQQQLRNNLNQQLAHTHTHTEFNSRPLRVYYWYYSYLMVLSLYCQQETLRIYPHCIRDIYRQLSMWKAGTRMTYSIQKRRPINLCAR